MKNNILFLAIIFLANIIQCITGFAGTVLAMPFSVVLIGYSAAKAILNVLGIAASVGIVLTNLGHINRKEFLKIISFMLPGVIVGFFLSGKLMEAQKIMYLLLGSVVVVFAVINAAKLFMNRPLKKPGKVFSAGILLAAGLIHGIFVCGGPLLVTYASQEMDDTEEFRSTLSASWIVLNGIMLFSDIKNGYFDKNVFVLLAIALVILVLSVFIGNAVEKHMSKKVFLILSYVLMLISGVSLLIK